jgi:hypothetical protein
VGRDNVDGIATTLRVGRFGVPIPVRARFSAPVQTGPVAHPASYTMGTGPLPGVKQPGRGLNQSSPSIVDDKERVELYIYSPFVLLWPVRRRPLLYQANVRH